MPAVLLPAPAAVIFDMDGVIIDRQAAANRALVEAAARHGVRLNVAELEDLLGANEEQFWTYVRMRYGLPEPVSFYAASYDEDQEIASYDETLLAPGLYGLFAELRAANVQIALSTSGSRKRMNAVIELFELAPWLDVALCREDVARPKPAPDLFLSAAAALGVAPSQCVVIEDSTSGILAAQSAGLPDVGFLDYAGAASLRPDAHSYLNSFEGLGFAGLQRLWAESSSAHPEL
jgi:HAD superfamily hydrolase (TIGR01509 family)